MTLSRLLYLYLYHAKNMFEHIIGLKAEINQATTLIHHTYNCSCICF